MFQPPNKFPVLDRYTEQEAWAIADRIIYNQMLKDWEELDLKESLR